MQSHARGGRNLSREPASLGDGRLEPGGQESLASAFPSSDGGALGSASIRASSVSADPLLIRQSVWVADERPVFDQINLVVRDMDATVEFYARLGVEVAPSVAPWARHHRALSAPGGLDFDLDSTEFATRWNSGWPPGQTGVVIGFRLASREAVDATYDDLTGAGYTGQQPPFDAFWGARYAVVVDPDGHSVGLMSPADPTRSTKGPTPTS